MIERESILDLTLYRDARGFEELREEWNGLLRRSNLDTIFLTWEWQATWWQHLGRTRGPLYLLAAREAEKLVGILPLYLGIEGRLKTLQVVGCIEVSDYLDLIIEAGREEAVYAAFLDWLRGPDAPDWDLLDLCNQPTGSLAYTRLPQMVEERGGVASVLDEDVCPVITLPTAASQGPDGGDENPDAGWDAYLAGIAKKQRHEIRRKMRRLAREVPDAAVRYVKGGDNLEVEIGRFIALHRLSSDDKDAFMTDQMQAFFLAIAAVLADNGWLQLSFLEMGGEPVASYFCFDYKNEILVYNSGYDPGAYRNLSPGWVLLANLIQHAIELGRDRFDFLQGDEDYKHRFGAVDEQVHRTLIWREGRDPKSAVAGE